MVKSKSRIKKKRRTKLSAEEHRKKRATRLFKANIRTVFTNCGFTHIATRDFEFEVQRRRGEIDALYAYENVLVVIEDTEIGSAGIMDHLRKKVDYWKHLREYPEDMLNGLSEGVPALDQYLKAHEEYGRDDYNIVFVYCSRNTIDKEYRDRHEEDCVFFEYAYLQYFLALSRTVHRTARFELFKFLGLNVMDIGASKSASNYARYSGLLLPESPSGFPKGHKLVSFLVDPHTLMEQAYVLRADGWRDTDCLYQRLLVRSKIDDMRMYLSKEQRVFVNNIIVTLPNDTKLQRVNDTNAELNSTRIEPVAVEIPRRFDTIGIIDGQHRVFCYHESDDKHDVHIAKFRKKQHLLVTGIVYPPAMSSDQRQKFEAKLFLEINDKQKRVKGDLKQAIALVVDPYSSVAIAKSVINGLGSHGPLAGLLETHFYDTGKLKTTSIVSYGLKYIVDLEGESSSLISRWRGERKNDVRSDRDVLARYVKYCIDQLNAFISAAKRAIGTDMWTADRKTSRVINATTINGLIYCMRLLIQNDQISDHETYAKKLASMNIDFRPSKFTYKSSHWRELGQKIYDQCFSR